MFSLLEGKEEKNGEILEKLNQIELSKGQKYASLAYQIIIDLKFAKYWSQINLILSPFINNSSVNENESEIKVDFHIEGSPSMSETKHVIIPWLSSDSLSFSSLDKLISKGVNVEGNVNYSDHKQITIAIVNSFSEIVYYKLCSTLISPLDAHISSSLPFQPDSLF